MVVKKLSLILVFALSVMGISAQNVDSVAKAPELKKLINDSLAVANAPKKAVKWTPSECVHLQTSPQIDRLMDLYLEANMETKTVQGYVIQIFYGRLQVAREMKEEFLKLYPDETVEIEYDSPDYKVFVGAYQNLDIARAALAQLKTHAEYSGSFVRPKEIKVFN